MVADMKAMRLAWFGIFCVIAKIRREETAGNGYHNFKLENDIILRERNFVIKHIIKFYNCEIEQETFEAIVRYYYDVVSNESRKAWEYKRELMVMEYEEAQLAAQANSDRYVFVCEEILPTKELEWMEDRLRAWTYKENLPDIMPVSFASKI